MASVDDETRYDCFISFHGKQRLEPLGFTFYPQYSNLREFTTLLSTKLQKVDARFPSIFLDSERLEGPIDDLFDAILQLRGGGVALVLLTVDYFKSSYCLAELRSFLQLASLPLDRRNESIKLRLVSLEPDEQGLTGIDKILQHVGLMAADEVLRPFVNELHKHIIKGVNHSRTADGTAHEIAEYVKSCWKETGDSCSKLGDNERISFVDMQRYFVHDDRFDLMEQLQVDGDDNLAVRRIMQLSIRNKTLSYRNIDPLLRACHFCQQDRKTMAAVNAYKRKWCSDDWAWSAQTRISLTRHLTDARHALRRDLMPQEQRPHVRVMIHALDSTRVSSDAVIPPLQSGLKPVALARTDTLDSAPEYPLLRVDGVTFWPLGYIDNRSSMALMAVDRRGHHLNTTEKHGARYICAIRQDEERKETVFVGQADKEIRMSWDELTDLAARFTNGDGSSE